MPPTRASYSCNGEHQLLFAVGITDAYDGDGHRVAKVGSKLYWYGAGGEILAETDTSGNTLNEYVYFGGKRVALLPSGSSAQYYVEDTLGSSRIVTTNAGAVCYDADFDPYGGERAVTNTCTQNNYKFEGKERDTETSNDEFGDRYYNHRFGRWLNADWSSYPEPVPYADLTNPQTLNLYSMVVNDPESFSDLDGHNTLPAGKWRVADRLATGRIWVPHPSGFRVRIFSYVFGFPASRWRSAHIVLSHSATSCSTASPSHAPPVSASRGCRACTPAFPAVSWYSTR